MLTLKLLRESPDFVIRRLAVKKFDAQDIVNKIIVLDDHRKALQTRSDALLAEQKKAAAAIGQLMKEGKKQEAEEAKREVAKLKARSSEVTDGDAALFSAITHDLTENFYFVFYSERLDMMWILSSAEFLNECVTNKTGKNKGKRSIWFNGNRKDKQTGIKKEYCKEQFEQYIAKDFSRFH